MSSHQGGLCDLHIHSIFSDSDADMESIFRQAEAKRLRCIAVTDHDTVSGLAAARYYSRQCGVELINAIEFSAQHQDSEVHVLGYFIDPGDATLTRELSHIKDLRRQRLICMAEALTSLGMVVDTDELFRGIGSTIPTRLHLAMYLVKKKKAASLKDVFNKYLSPGKPAYKSRFKHSVEEVIAIIRNCGGCSILAHPHMVRQQSWIEEFIHYGLDGLEVVYPGMSCARRSLYLNLALKYDLLKSGGSDAHGSYKEFTEIGGVSVSYEWVEEMKSRLNGK